MKLDLWKKNVESKKYGMFKFLTTLDSAPNEVSHEIIDHLSLLNAELKHKDETQRLFSNKLLA